MSPTRPWPIFFLYLYLLADSINGNTKKAKFGPTGSEELCYKHCDTRIILLIYVRKICPSVSIPVKSMKYHSIIVNLQSGNEPHGKKHFAFKELRESRDIFNFTKQLFGHVINRIPALIARQIRFVWTQKLQYKELPHHSLSV